jgi:hypothetical protein
MRRILCENNECVHCHESGYCKAEQISIDINGRGFAVCRTCETPEEVKPKGSYAPIVCKNANCGYNDGEPCIRAYNCEGRRF